MLPRLMNDPSCYSGRTCNNETNNKRKKKKKRCIDIIHHKIYICGTLDYYAMIQWRENTIPIEMTKYGYDPLLYYKDSLMATVAIKKKKKCLSI